MSRLDFYRVSTALSMSRKLAKAKVFCAKSPEETSHFK